MDHLYPEHCQALTMAGLVQGEIPKLKDILPQVAVSETALNDENKKKNPGIKPRDKPIFVLECLKFGKEKICCLKLS